MERYGADPARTALELDVAAMPSIETLLAFYGVSLLLALAPGPDNLFVFAQSAQHGWRTGLSVVLGLCVGIVGHTAAVALGLAAVLAASAIAFTVLKLLGAAYLLWLAWDALRARPQAAPLTGAGSGEREPLAGSQMVRMIGRGVIMNLTNPKVLIFFLAFLPQFIDPTRGSAAWQTLLLGMVFVLATLPVFGGIAFFSGTFGAMLMRSARTQRVLNRMAALVFVGLALRLVAEQR